MNDTKKIEEIQKRAENKSKLQKYFTLFLVIIVIIFFLILAFHNLFNIKTIEVTGISNTAPYTTEDVSKFLDIKKDTNLITYDSRSAQKALLEEFPYINTVEIKKKCVVLKKRMCLLMMTLRLLKKLLTSLKVLEKVEVF